ncbi:MAG: ACT domain-containing protein [Anaerolineae bacterium]|nr:ACT domain-containing protein [Anaerolineae bacterium]
MLPQKKIKVGGILHTKGLCLVGVMSAPDRPGLAAAVFEALGNAQLNAQFIVQSIDLNNNSHIQFCVAREDVVQTLKLLEPIAQRLGAQKVVCYPSVALVAVFGPDFRERPGIAGMAFGALAERGINILAVSTSISTISCVIRESDYSKALEGLQKVFELP